MKRFMKNQKMGVFRRFVDSPENLLLLDHCADFHVRKKNYKKIIFLYSTLVVSSIICFMLMSAMLSLILEAVESSNLYRFLTIILALTSIVGGVFLFTHLFAKRIGDAQLLTEFQNMLYASSAYVGSYFFVIIDKEQDMLLADTNFRKYLGRNVIHQKVGKVDLILKHPGLTDASRKKIKKAFDEHKSISVPFTLKINSRMREIILRVDPLSKPQGYFCIRGFKKGTKF